MIFRRNDDPARELDTDVICADAEILERYLRDELDMPSISRVRAHLTTCNACMARLDAIEANLELDRELRGVMPPAPPGFRIIRELGAGGMAVVYLAEQAHPQRHVALKVMRPLGLSPTARTRFLMEAEVLARLRDPRIAEIHAAGVERDQPWMAMEHVPGLPLDRYADTHRLAPAARLRLMAELADAVHHAHVNGVVHRDLKPANILVEERDGEPAPKILDFGVARIIHGGGTPAVGPGPTLDGALVGTPPYMSPEQLAGDPRSIDARCDVYALGILAFVLLSGRHPFDFDGCSLLEGARRVRETEPVRLGALVPALRGDVDAIVMRAIERDPTRRYQSAAELAADLRRFLHDEPVTARPPGTWRTLRRLARRQRAVLLGVGCTALAVGAGVGLSARQADRAERAEARSAERLEQRVEQADYLMNHLIADLGHVAGTEQARMAVAEQIHAYFELVGPEAADQMEVQRCWFESKRVLCGLLRAAGDDAGALAMMRASHALLERTIERFPDARDWRFQLAYSHRYMGTVLTGVDAEAAGMHRARSLALLEALVVEEPDAAHSLKELSTVLHRRARLTLQTDPVEAQRLLRRALALIEQLPPDDAYAARARRRLAASIAAAEAHAGER